MSLSPFTSKPQTPSSKPASPDQAIRREVSPTIKTQTLQQLQKHGWRSSFVSRSKAVRIVSCGASEHVSPARSSCVFHVPGAYLHGMLNGIVLCSVLSVCSSQRSELSTMCHAPSSHHNPGWLSRMAGAERQPTALETPDGSRAVCQHTEIYPTCMQYAGALTHTFLLARASGLLLCLFRSVKEPFECIVTAAASHLCVVFRILRVRLSLVYPSDRRLSSPHSFVPSFSTCLYFFTSLSVCLFFSLL